MRALLLSGHASRPHTRLADWPDQAIGPKDVEVRMETAALNPLDAKIATGAMKDWFPILFPYVPGTDFAGVVTAVGAAVDGLAVGDPVFGRADPVRGGAVAERIVLDVDHVARRPLGLSASNAACLPTPAGVALQILEMMARADDEPLLVLGDGLVAQMARGLAGRAAWQVADTRQLEGLGRFRHAIDTTGGPLLDAAWGMLEAGAHLVTLTAPADAATAAARKVRTDFVVLETSRRQLDAVALAAADGVLDLRVDHHVAFDEAASMFDRYVARELAGKIVIEGAAR